MASLTYVCFVPAKGLVRDLSANSSNAMFDELAERSLTSPLAGTKHTYVRLAIIIHCKILALNIFFSNGKTLN